MCKACKMDPREMRTFYERQGAVEVEDFDDEIRYSHPPRKNKKKQPKKRGCPGNDFGPHVYVWMPSLYKYSWSNDRDSFFFKHGFHRNEVQVCCGCEKRNKYRYTAEMQKRINRLGWYKANYGD